MTASRRAKPQLPHLNVFTVQLLGKDDPSQEDPEVYIDRWRSYIASYTSVSYPPPRSFQPLPPYLLQETPTKGLTGCKYKPPFLRRWDYLSRPCETSLHVYTHRNRAITPDQPAPEVIAGNALEMKICVRTYRIFYVPNTADFFYKPSSPSLAGIPRRPKGTWLEKLETES